MKIVKGLLTAAVTLAFLLPALAADEPDLEKIRAQLPETITPISKEDLLKNVPNFFYFDYTYQPMPGKRLWLRVSADKWIERYPDGSESTFVVLGHTEVAKVSGTILIKVSGDQAKTQTENNGRLQTFIPDKQNEVKHFKYRNGGRGDVRWSDLGEMKGIE